MLLVMGMEDSGSRKSNALERRSPLTNARTGPGADTTVSGIIKLELSAECIAVR